MDLLYRKAPPKRSTSLVYLPTLTPWVWVSRLWIENFDLTLTHAYGPISHTSLEKGCCSHISDNCWRTSGKYAMCNRVICTKTNNRLKSAREWQFFRWIFSDFRIREEVVLGKQYPRSRSENLWNILGNVQIIFIIFRKVFGHFWIWVRWFHKSW